MFLFPSQEVDEDKEHLPATNIDDVTITFDDNDLNPSHQPRADSQHTNNSNSSTNNKNSSSNPYYPDNQRRPLPAQRTSLDKPTPPGILSNSSAAVPKSISAAAAVSMARAQANPQNNGRPDEKKDPTKEDLDADFQNMFLERVDNKTRKVSQKSRPSGSFRQNNQPPQKFYQPPMMAADKSRNGVNNVNNNNSSISNTNPSLTSTSTTNNGPNKNSTNTAMMTSSSSNSNNPNINNNNNNFGVSSQTSVAVISPRGNASFRDGQLRRFVAPPNAPVVGSDDDEKTKCCVIL